jgi:hypothetical protein
MKIFEKFTPELIKNSEIAATLRVNFMEGISKQITYPFSVKKLLQKTEWFQTTCANILDIKKENPIITAATKMDNLEKFFDHLEIKTWTIGNKRNCPPISTNRKADIIKQFLFQLSKNDYDIIPVLEEYLKEI